MSKRIISFFLIISILVSACCFSASAAESSPSTFWDMTMWELAQRSRNVPDNSPLSQLIGYIGSEIAGAASEEVCPSPDSSDGLHHCTKRHSDVIGFGYDDEGAYTTMTCDYCGQEFKARSSDFGRAGEGFGGSRPAQTITNTGKFYWQPKHDYIKLNARYADYTYTRYCEHHDGTHTYPGDAGILTWSHLSPYEVSFTVFPSSGVVSFEAPRGFVAYFSGNVPVSGYYKLLSSHSAEYRMVNSYQQVFDGPRDWSADSTIGPHYSADAVLSVSCEPYLSSYVNDCVYCSGAAYAPTYEVTPDSSINISTGDTYNIDNRVSNYVTQYLVDNSVNTTQIINETNNTYYSPITNETYDMSGWTYDYSTRTYNITIDGSDGATVTFGDNAIQIVEGNVTNNYYYYITPSSDPDDPDDPGGDSSGLLAWLQEVWPNLMAKLDEIKDAIGDGVSGSGSDHWWQDSDNPDDPDDPDADDDLGILELFKTVLRGLINILNGFLSLIFDGIENLIEWIGSIGDFFDYFSPNSDVNIWTVEEGST